MFLLMSWLCLLVSCTHVDAEKECIRFSVPMMNSLTVAENTTKNISFQVINECSTGFNFTFDVQHGKRSNLSPVCLGVGPKKMHQGKCTCVKDGQNLSCNLTAMFDRNKTIIIFKSGEFGPSDEHKLKKKEFSANVTYPPTITSFTLGGGQPANNTVDANEHGSIQAVCSWENGNPRRRMLLRNPENKTIYSKVPMAPDRDAFRSNVFDNNATCSDTGLYMCEAEGTSVKESVFLRMRCPPQFWPPGNEPNSAVVFAQAEAQFDFNILSSQNITKCTLAGPRNITRECKDIPEEVNITGSPPKLKLTVVIRNVSEEDSGTWQLSVENGFQGTASIPNTATVNFTLDVTQHPRPVIEMWQILMIISIVVAAAALGLCIFITVRVYRSRKKSKGKKVNSPNGQTFGSREPLAARNSKEDCGMIVNELYSSSEPQGESIMITNDIYEGSGDTRTSTAPALAPGYEEVKIDAGNGTVAMVSTKTTGNNAGVYANTAEADAQRKKEQEKDKNKKRPKERAPGPPASGMGEAKKNKKESNKKEKEASPSKSKAQTNTADAKTTNTAEKPEKGRNSGKKEAKPNSTEKTATTGNPTNDENKKTNADASKTKPDAAKTKSDPAKTKTDASKSKPDPAKHDAPGAKADAPDTNANARTKTDANEGAASNDDQGSILVDARVPNAEGCLYGQLDFSRVKPRTTVIKDLPSTDYAEINFKAPPPPPPAPEN